MAVQADAQKQLQLAQQQLESQTQQATAMLSALRSISCALPPTAAQQHRWQAEEEAACGLSSEAGFGCSDSALRSSVRPEEVLEQLQSLVQSVHAEQDR